MSDQVYVSITGLKLRAFWHFPAFAIHAAASMRQAHRTEGCLQADATRINGIYHTRTVWTSRKAMHAYLVSGAHKKAMQAFDRIATGRTYGGLVDGTPSWPDALDLWRDHGRDHVSRR